jgi:hypothetical protein
MKTDFPFIQKLAEHGITTDLFLNNDPYGILHYLTQNVHEFRIGQVQEPRIEHIEAWIGKHGVNNVLNDTRLLRMYSLNDCIIALREPLTKSATDEFSKLHDTKSITGRWPDLHETIKPTINEIFPRFDLDELVDNIRSEEDVHEYAKEHGRIMAGCDWKSQKLHAESNTGQSIKNWMEKLQDHEAGRKVEPASSERQSIRDMINGMNSHLSVENEMQSEME